DVRTTPTQAMARQDLQRWIAVAMADLPEEFRRTLELFYWADLPMLGIAEELGVALGTVKSRLHRGRALLTAAIEGIDLEDSVRATILEHVAERYRSSEDDG